MIDRRTFLNYGLGTAAGLSPALCLAQSSWPEKPVKIIVLFGPRSASDTLTGMLAERLQVRLGQPPAIVERLSKAAQEVSREPGMQERFLGAGFVTGSPQETAAMAARERVKWKEVVRLSGAKLDRRVLRRRPAAA